MNILIFNWRDMKNSWAGGGELYIHELAKRWKEKGNNVSIVTSQDPTRKLPKQETIDGITIYRKGNRFTVYFWAFLTYLTKLRKHTDFIVDVENGIPFFTPLFSIKKKVVLVYHVHGKQFFYEFGFPLNVIGYVIERYIFSFLYRNVPVISISKSTKSELMKLGFIHSHIHIVNPGVSYKPYMKKEKYKRPTLIYLGRIKRYKRLDLLMEIFPKVLQKVPKVRLIIAGWGTEAPQISDIVMKNGYRKNILLLGPVSENEKKTLLQRSWLMVNPSLHEGWGISVIEANHYGTPAVAFKVPGLSDAVIENKTGFLCKNEDEFVDTVVKVISKNKLLGSISKNAQNWARTLTWDSAAKKSLFLIKNVYMS